MRTLYCHGHNRYKDAKGNPCFRSDGPKSDSALCEQLKVDRKESLAYAKRAYRDRLKLKRL